MRKALTLLLWLAVPAIAADQTALAKKRWADSPYGPMLERILPPGFEAALLPQPASRGAQLELRYCVQCHNLPNPAMHNAEKWAPIFERMVVRMEGKGNMGKLMADMMAGVAAPTPEEARVLVAYLKKYAQAPLDPKRIPEIDTPAGEAFRIACQQCHVLPDPGRHTASEWPAVVARMERNMEWMNRVVGSKPVRGEPQLRVEDINAFLTRFARANPKSRKISP
jgi:mono/diheme cytochrome c family protein